MCDDQPLGEDLGREISAVEYNNQRLNPGPGQDLYLHLSDLRVALESVRTDSALSLLDYGCGGSPYRGLFPNATYKRADYLQTGDLDYLLGSDARVPEQDGFFDLILSTQVLEHVQEPAVYLSECHRLLNSSGRLVLTTHGAFPEHGCPYDYQRWTADGLRITLERQGFRVVTLRKLTSGPRALLFLLETFIPILSAPENTLFGLGLKFVRIVLSQCRTWIDKNCDRHFAGCRQVDLDSKMESSFYIGIFVIAEKC